MGLLKSLFGGSKGKRSSRRFDAPLAPSKSVAIVGDIHGRIDLLDKLLLKAAPDSVDAYVFVGDYIDRGDDSRDVLRRIFELSKTLPNIVCLMGNHEKMLLDFIDRPVERGERWLRFGGLQTIASFGLLGLSQTMSGEALEKASLELRAALGLEIENWLRSMDTSWNTGNLWVVHGAADPNFPMNDQADNVLLWGHPDFGNIPRSDGCWVVHGHTIVDQASVKNGVISIDTGGYATGRLTAAVISTDGDVSFVQT